MQTFDTKNQNNQRNYSVYAAKTNSRYNPLQVADSSLMVDHPTFGNQAAQKFAQTCPLKLPGPLSCPLGGVCHMCPMRMQAKLKVSQPNDYYEQEADRVAEAVLRMPESYVYQIGKRPGPKSPNYIQKIYSQENKSLQMPSDLLTIEKKFEGEPINGFLQLNRKDDHDCIGCGNTNNHLTVKKQFSSTSEEFEKALKCSGTGYLLDFSMRNLLEPRFGYNFSNVRIHTDSAAAEAAKLVHANAITTGYDIYFGQGCFQPQTKEGKKIIAHELTHVIQQNNPPQLQKHLAVSQSPNKLYQIEGADLVAITLPAYDSDINTKGHQPQIQCDFLDYVVEDIESKIETAEGIVEWIETDMGQAALSAAKTIIAVFGGKFAIAGTTILLTIPKVNLFDMHEFPFEFPGIFVPIPLYEKVVMLDTIPAYGEIGFEISLSPAIVLGIGPGILHSTTIVIDPAASFYKGSADLEVIRSVGVKITAFIGLAGHGGIVLPIEIPIPINILSFYGGLQGILSCWAVHSDRIGVAITYASGAFSVDSELQIAEGMLLQSDLHGWLSAVLLGKIICQYVYPLVSVRKGTAWSISAPILVRGGTIMVGTISSTPLPIEDIATAIKNTPIGFSCPGLPGLIDLLCEANLLSPEFCDGDDQGIAPTGGTITLPDILVFDRLAHLEQWLEQSKEYIIFSNYLLIPHLGLVLVQVTANGAAFASILAGVGAAYLRNIKIPLNPFSKVQKGNAELYVPADLSAELILNGFLTAKANWWCLANVIGVSGTLGAFARGFSLVGLATPMPIPVTYENNKLSFKIEVILSGDVGLGFSIDAGIGIDVFGYSLWTRVWKIVDRELNNPWHTDLYLDIDFDLGVLKLVLIDAIPSSIPFHGILRPMRNSGIGLPPPLVNLKSFIKAKKEGKQDPCEIDGNYLPPLKNQAPTGSKKDPIEMIWCKSLKHFKNPIYLYGGKYYRNSKKKLLSGAYIGADYWPSKGDLLLRRQTTRGNVADIFKEELTNEGFEHWDEYSPDHVLDLFFAGPDSYSNLWPLDRSINAFAGTWHAGQPVTYSDPHDHRPKIEAICSANLVNRWFIIKDIRSPF